MRSRTLATVAVMLVSGVGYYQSLTTPTLTESRHEGCLRRCWTRVLAQSQYPENVETRCARICIDAN